MQPHNCLQQVKMMQSSYTINITEDSSDIVYFSYPDAWQEERNFMDCTDEADNVKYWVDGDILEDLQEDNLMDTMNDDDAHVPETKMTEHFIYGAIRNVSLQHTWFSNQVILAPSQQPFKDSSTRKVSILEWIFLIINVLMELISAAFDQLSSVNKPQYALIAMLMSLMATLICIIELTYKAGKERVVLKWESKLPWFYHPYPSKRPFGTFPEMIGLVCAILQTTLSAVAYTFYHQHSNYPLKVSFWPVVFALGLFCSKFM